MRSNHEFPSEIIWIKKYDSLPNTCCDCGLYTDHRVTVKHVDIISQQGRSGDGCGPVLLALVIHVALGPVGWLLSALMNGEETEVTKSVKHKAKIKISQCQLCYGMKPPEVVESRLYSFSFLVHPRFRQRFEELKRETDEEA